MKIDRLIRIRILERFSRTRNKSILLIEDDAAMRESARLLLELEGYLVSIASNGREGLEVLKTMPRPHLILLDLIMPVMTGWEFLALRDKDGMLASIPVVIMSASRETEESSAADYHLKKPFEAEQLLSIVRTSCD